MEMFKVGERRKEWRHGVSAFSLSYSHCGGFVLMAFLNDICKAELDEFESGDFEICFTTVHNIMIFGFKFGTMPWSDCPYYNVEDFESPSFDDKMGSPFNLILIDSHIGELKHMRLIGLGHEFSNSFFSTLAKLEKNHDIDLFKQKVMGLQNVLSTNNLVEQALTVDKNYYSTSRRID